MTTAGKPGTLRFFFVDVFAAEPLTGNPLAVVIGGEHLSLELMQRIGASSISRKRPSSCRRRAPERIAVCDLSRRQARRSSAPDTTPWAPGGGSPRAASCH